MAIPQLDYWSVPRCWPGECVAILAGGKSLRREHVEHVRGKCRVIAINRAGLKGWPVSAPWADMLWGCDADRDRFWGLHPKAVEFPGIKVVVRPCGDTSSMPAKWPLLARLAEAGVNILRHSGLDYPSAPKHEGISRDPRVVRGNNSLAQILSIIAHTGASTVLLLGADMRGGHWHQGYGTSEPDYANSIIPPFATMAKPLADAGVTVLNCSPNSALPYWPHVKLEDVI